MNVFGCALQYCYIKFMLINLGRHKFRSTRQGSTLRVSLRKVSVLQRRVNCVPRRNKTNLLP